MPKDEAQPQLSTMPFEVLEHVFRRLPNADLSAVAQSNRLMAAVARSTRAEKIRKLWGFYVSDKIAPSVLFALEMHQMHAQGVKLPEVYRSAARKHLSKLYIAAERGALTKNDNVIARYCVGILYSKLMFQMFHEEALTFLKEAIVQGFKPALYLAIHEAKYFALSQSQCMEMLESFITEDNEALRLYVEEVFKDLGKSIGEDIHALRAVLSYAQELHERHALTHYRFQTLQLMAIDHCLFLLKYLGDTDAQREAFSFAADCVQLFEDYTLLGYRSKEIVMRQWRLSERSGALGFAFDFSSFDLRQSRRNEALGNEILNFSAGEKPPFEHYRDAARLGLRTALLELVECEGSPDKKLFYLQSLMESSKDSVGLFFQERLMREILHAKTIPHYRMHAIRMYAFLRDISWAEAASNIAQSCLVKRPLLRICAITREEAEFYCDYANHHGVPLGIHSVEPNQGVTRVPYLIRGGTPPNSPATAPPRSPDSPRPGGISTS